MDIYEAMQQLGIADEPTSEAATNRLQVLTFDLPVIPDGKVCMITRDGGFEALPTGSPIRKVDCFLVMCAGDSCDDEDCERAERLATEFGCSTHVNMCDESLWLMWDEDKGDSFVAYVNSLKVAA